MCKPDALLILRELLHTLISEIEMNRVIRKTARYPQIELQCSSINVILILQHFYSIKQN